MAEDVKHIVRIANTDLIGEKTLKVGLTKIKGIGVMYSNMVCRLANVNIEKKVGLLTSTEIERLNNVLQHPDKYPIPDWMMNRRKDWETGKTTHIIANDLDFTHEQDMRRLKKIKSYRGLRHMVGLTVRGQRTKSNFRRNKGKVVGVKRKAEAKAKGGKV
jgi:small subunit ribosomal protein S13